MWKTISGLKCIQYLMKAVHSLSQISLLENIDLIGSLLQPIVPHN